MMRVYFENVLNLIHGEKSAKLKMIYDILEN